jgi:hypothetical protein
MAQKVTVELVDDLDGRSISEGDGRTIVFALENKTYEIDLSSGNADRLSAALAPFIDVARRVGSGAHAVSRSRRTRGSADLAVVRAWASENGHSVSARGRVPSAVLEAYAAAH